jgi:3-oxoacyl-[acyl-carrier protein] reductase
VTDGSVPPELRARRLAGRVAIVTGAGRGIGRAIALALGREGAAVAAAARTLSEIDAVAHELSTLGVVGCAIPADVTDEASVHALFEATAHALGAPSIVVANAGVGHKASVTETSAADFDRVMAVNVRGVFLTARAALHAMTSCDRDAPGRLVVVASVAATRGFPEWATYSASKFAVRGFCEALAEEARPLGVQVTLLLPGAVDTDLWNDLPAPADRTRMLRVQDVAEAVVFCVTRDPHAHVPVLALDPAGGAL